MKFNFKIQQYQTDAVESTVAVFAGQPTQGGFLYHRDLGKNDAGRITYEDDYAGFRNADVELSDQNMLANIRNIQESNNIPLSKALSHDLGKVGLDSLVKRDLHRLDRARGNENQSQCGHKDFVKLVHYAFLFDIPGSTTAPSPRAK